LNAFVAFDWGDAIALEAARALEGAEQHVLPRRRRTPSSFTYHPPPLRFALPDVRLELPELGNCAAAAVATVFDFGAVSLDLNIPFDLSPDALLWLSGWLAEPVQVLAVARSTMEPLYRRLKPAIRDPQWRDMVEEYFVFQFEPNEMLATAWFQENTSWLGNLLRLESRPLSEDEATDALRLRLSYSPDDLFLPDWGAAVVRDQDCEETLQTIEFANLLLLELRHIDDRLDDFVLRTERLVTRRGRRLPWFGTTPEQRQLGEMNIEAATLFERSTNALKLVGDTYLARVYRLLADRFRLGTWETGIRRKLDTLEGIYQIVTDRAEAARSATLELIIILLILVEIVMGLWKH
jgi:hypothetical protein